jgi:hypothetical protein
VNTGAGWRSWRGNGSLVGRYIRESRAVRAIPVLTYYMLLQSHPAAGADEAERVLSNLRNVDTMRAYWHDLRLVLRRARGRGLVVLHVEPDLWGYMQQATAQGPAGNMPAAVGSTGDPALGGGGGPAAGGGGGGVGAPPGGPPPGRPPAPGSRCMAHCRAQ